MHLLRILAIAVGTGALIWGATLVHRAYLHELNAGFIATAGADRLGPGIATQHTVEAARTALVHVGLIVLGTGLIVAAVLAVPRRRKP